MLPKAFNVTGNCSSDDQSYNKKKDCDNRSHRSRSEPPKHLKNARGCPRTNDGFCSEATNASHNSMKVLTVGVDPRQIEPQQCTASCCTDHNASGSKQRQPCTASCCTDHNASGSKQRQPCTASCCADHNASGSKQRQPCTASCCADHNASGSKQRQWMAQQQAQQQLQRQQQMQQLQQQQQSCYNTFQPNMNSTMMPQQQQQKKCCPQPAARPLTAHERSHARQECCAAQQQQQKYPSKPPRAGNAQQYEVCSSFEQSSNYKGCNQSQPKQSSCCQQRGTSPTAMQREVTFNRASGSYTPCQTTGSRKPNSPTLRPDKLPANMSPEELYVQRANTLFMEMLVLDRTYPGVIQETLDGQADFNDLSFQIAFAGKIPSKPCPMEPISLLEAIQMRIDYERDEIERKMHNDIEEEEKPECRKDKEKEKPRGMYYAHEDKMSKAPSHRSHAGCSKCGHMITDEDIDRHFAMKNKSEVNTAVRAFIKAQNNHKNEESLFAANINSHESDFFGAPIKMKVYNGTTWPIN